MSNTLAIWRQHINIEICSKTWKVYCPYVFFLITFKTFGNIYLPKYRQYGLKIYASNYTAKLLLVITKGMRKKIALLVAIIMKSTIN